MREAEEFDLLKIQEQFLHCVSITRDATTAVFSNLDESDLEVSTLQRFFWLSSSRSQAICFLMFSGYLWDAEIILRSFCETNAKIWFICYRSKESRKTLLEEFWGTYAESQNLKTANRSETARSLAQEMGKPHEETVYSFLQREDIFPQSTENKARRRELEQKWSFSEIIGYLKNDAKAIAPLDGISSLAHMYGMQSHLCHADNVALDLMHDHATRTPEVRRLKEISQLCRIMSDVCSYWLFSLEALQFAQGIAWNRRSDLWEAWMKLHALTKPAKDAFDQSQKEFYEEWAQQKE